MNAQQKYTFTQYLAAKKAIDDRSLNRLVWSTLARQVHKPFAEKPLRILEVGAGIGSMIERTFEWGLYAQAMYTAVDANTDVVRQAKEHLPEWAKRHGFSVFHMSGDTMRLQSAQRRADVHLICEDIFDFVPRAKAASQPWDLIIAHAFLDLVHLPTALPEILGLGSEEGLFYFSLNFDGVTVLEPTIDAALDAAILERYHHSMDQRRVQGKPSGDSCTGRHLFHALEEVGAQILEAGASDWVVFPRQGGYSVDETIFLHYIIHTIATALQNDPLLDAQAFDAWIKARHQQVQRGELVYLAHQLDFCGRIRA